jgi:hypothetical protein
VGRGLLPEGRELHGDQRGRKSYKSESKNHSVG